MNIKQFLTEVLTGLEATFPPSKNGHHAITAARYGSDKTGYEAKLALQINDNGVFRCLFLEEDDLDRTPEQLISAVKAALAVPFPQEQIGVSGVQYVKDE